MEVITVKPGDVVVYSAPIMPDVEKREKIKAILYERIGFITPVMFLASGVKIDHVIRPEAPVVIENPIDKALGYFPEGLWFETENGSIQKYEADMFLNPASPVVVDIDDYPLFYHPEKNWQSITKAKLISGKIVALEYQDERKFLGGKVKRKEIPLMETAASIEVIESEL